jgi:hypothetical protein
MTLMTRIPTDYEMDCTSEVESICIAASKKIRVNPRNPRSMKSFNFFDPLLHKQQESQSMSTTSKRSSRRSQ